MFSDPTSPSPPLSRDARTNRESAKRRKSRGTEKIVRASKSGQTGHRPVLRRKGHSGTGKLGVIPLFGALFYMIDHFRIARYFPQCTETV